MKKIPSGCRGKPKLYVFIGEVQEGMVFDRKLRPHRFGILSPMGTGADAH